MTYKTQIAVSACLLGQKVRYDGKTKKHALIIDMFLNKGLSTVELIPFCPEVAIGLGVPREKIQVIRNKDKQIRLVGVEDHTLDVTHELQSYAENFLLQYPDIKYYIVKSKSPSCGYQSTPLFISQVDDEKSGLMKKHDNYNYNYNYNYEQAELTSGLFVQTLQTIEPELVIIEETQFDSEEACLMFFQQIQNG
ncbi:MAG: DUF523 domain-containing protein [gamma proteobacterium symbiont of Bathyaustriella thionipta]|nr:DUF523 domain-containing protein [gamma proteobacterium symbiont of Bathyaustriella thionipta]MCU7949750.1 DUF523 domain-containing protein [gamma proteobacterium symbiont of Bathyaustriella thionipta]MCU7952481.1 DUF523 domain-containing protein [gamma proteobacterium symbiont of Bathyaustriella thionipta]MCU7956344.1 DUF523 domain-containing protein [gamma proteobacterium symbiont of Bathyaustriella thionipta]MCU7965813.1 DUF523 domain-containing protein [gamma proteobacterium symbiont of 